MKHLKQLAYQVIQFHWREVLVMFTVAGALTTLLFPDSWWITIPLAFFGAFAWELVTLKK